jgi:phenylalanyl-tRNA synthetase alpha chain
MSRDFYIFQEDKRMDIKGMLQQMSNEAMIRIEKAVDLDEIEKLRVEYLGKKGALTAILREMGNVNESERPIFGQMANQTRNLIDGSLTGKKDLLHRYEEEKNLTAEKLDVTLPGKKARLGKIHPISKTLERIEEVFLGLGYIIAEGPEVEYTRYNFEALNTPENHPARDLQDTFYINGNIVLRTQTSPVQIRVMEKNRPPIKIISPGRVYRSDAVDSTHSPIFHQVEGLVVDKGITMGDLIGTLREFARGVFGENTQIRVRPHHFPFTEPSAEVDVSCWNCGGTGCRVCKGEGWVEILGAGMVHPSVLAFCNIDPGIYTGFAFGLGVERVAMGKFNIDDLRHLYENDIRFLEQL